MVSAAITPHVYYGWSGWRFILFYHDKLDINDPEQRDLHKKD